MFAYHIKIDKMKTITTMQAFSEFVDDFEGELVIRNNSIFHAGELIAVVNLNR